MQKVFHPAHERGTANFGWLKANYSFSFANYFNPKRVKFGRLRVLNDDTIAADKGFGEHPHKNMEIVTIPLKGALKHQDSMGNSTVINTGEVQVMSAGTGVKHSEFNPDKEQETNLLQIWVHPEKKHVEPRYGQEKFSAEELKNKLLNVVSPKDDNDGKALWIHQQAYFNLGELETGKKITYNLHKSGHGIYCFLISGEIEIANETLNPRDAIGIWDCDDITIDVKKTAKLLLIEVPMN